MIIFGDDNLIKNMVLVICIIVIVSFFIITVIFLLLFPIPQSVAIIHITEGSVDPNQKLNIIPKTVIINPGTIVRWINDGDASYKIVPHQSYSEFWHGKFGIKSIQNSESYEYEFNEIGTITYHVMPNVWTASYQKNNLINGTVVIVP